jgi:hypothetical protein
MRIMWLTRTTGLVATRERGPRTKARQGVGIALAVQLLASVSLSGWLHVVWNGAPHVFLVDEQGIATRLVLEEALTVPLGGLRALNRKRVMIEGERLGGSPETVRVLAIALAPESG